MTAADQAGERFQIGAQGLDAKEMTVSVDGDMEAVPETLAAYKVKLKGRRELVFSYPPSKIHAGEILDAVAAAGLGVLDVTTREAELEDIFLSLTGGAKRTGQ